MFTEKEGQWTLHGMKIDSCIQTGKSWGSIILSKKRKKISLEVTGKASTEHLASVSHLLWSESAWLAADPLVIWTLTSTCTPGDITGGTWTELCHRDEDEGGEWRNQRIHNGTVKNSRYNKEDHFVHFNARGYWFFRKQFDCDVHRFIYNFALVPRVYFNLHNIVYWN